MTKTERRSKDFSSGMRKLGNQSLNYIHKLAQVLLMVEHTFVYQRSEKKTAEIKNKDRNNAPLVQIEFMCKETNK
jgi:hypothetical protein